VHAPADTQLFWVLRERLGMTGTTVSIGFVSGARAR